MGGQRRHRHLHVQQHAQRLGSHLDVEPPVRHRPVKDRSASLPRAGDVLTPFEARDREITDLRKFRRQLGPKLLGQQRDGVRNLHPSQLEGEAAFKPVAGPRPASAFAVKFQRPHCPVIRRDLAGGALVFNFGGETAGRDRHRNAQILRHRQRSCPEFQRRLGLPDRTGTRVQVRLNRPRHGQRERGSGRHLRDVPQEQTRIEGSAAGLHPEPARLSVPDGVRIHSHSNLGKRRAHADRDAGFAPREPGGRAPAYLHSDPWRINFPVAEDHVPGVHIQLQSEILRRPAGPVHVRACLKFQDGCSRKGDSKLRHHGGQPREISARGLHAKGPFQRLEVHRCLQLNIGPWCAATSCESKRGFEVRAFQHSLAGDSCIRKFQRFAPVGQHQVAGGDMRFPFRGDILLQRQLRIHMQPDVRLALRCQAWLNQPRRQRCQRVAKAEMGDRHGRDDRFGVRPQPGIALDQRRTIPVSQGRLRRHARGPAGECALQSESRRMPWRLLTGRRQNVQSDARDRHPRLFSRPQPA